VTNIKTVVRSGGTVYLYGINHHFILSSCRRTFIDRWVGTAFHFILKIIKGTGEKLIMIGDFDANMCYSILQSSGTIDYYCDAARHATYHVQY
jgi:hypothetical protein